MVTCVGLTYVCLLIILPNVPLSDAQWSQLTHRLPRITHGQVTGIWNNSFFMIGGSNNSLQLLEYDMNMNKLIDYGRNYFSYGTYASAQMYTQVGEFIYYFQSNDQMMSFNMATKTYTTYSNAVADDFLFEADACLIKTDTHLVVIGGSITNPVYTRVNDVWSYNIADARWDNIYKPMNIARSTHSCTFVSDTNSIYVIGGYDGTNYLDTVEKLVVTDASNEWAILEHKLTTGMEGTRSLLGGNKIFIIGGLPWHNVPNVHSLDIRTDKIIGEPTMEMPFKAIKQACSVTDPLTILCAGGWTEFGRTDIIIEYNGPTISPTDSPTSVPSDSPTVAPTHIPTDSPSKAPSNTPTDEPSNSPSQDPTISPSQAPSYLPSFTPSNSPTLSPTPSPTAQPSTIAELLAKHVDEKNHANIFNVAIYGSVMAVPSLCILASFIVHRDKIYKYAQSFLYRIDNVSYWYVIFYFVQMTDLFSDVVFSFQLYSYYDEMNNGHISVSETVNKSVVDTVHVLLYLAVIFTVIPYILNFFSSISIILDIAADKNVNEFTKTYFKGKAFIYSILTLMSGGSFYTLKLINSNFYGLRVFQCGMSQNMMAKYVTHKIWLTTVLENIPQLMIHCIFIIRLRMFTGTVIIAFLSSFFNVLLSVMSARIASKMKKGEIEIPFKISMTWTPKPKANIDGMDPFRETGRRKELALALSKLDKNGEFEFEVLASNKKDDHACVYGVVKCEEKCVKKEEKIGAIFVGVNLRNAVMDGFTFSDVNKGYVNAFDFGFVATVGDVEEFNLSPTARQFLPIIWEQIPWEVIKDGDKRVTDKVIQILRDEMSALKNKSVIKTEGAKHNKLKSLPAYSVMAGDARHAPIAKPNDVISTKIELGNVHNATSDDIIDREKSMDSILDRVDDSCSTTMSHSAPLNCD